MKLSHRGLICVSLMADDVKVLFHPFFGFFFFLATCIYSLLKYLFKSFAQFLTGVFFLLLSYESSLHIQVTNSFTFSAILGLAIFFS